METNQKSQLLVLTHLEDVPLVMKRLKSYFEVHYYPDAQYAELLPILPTIEYIFTNPNNSRLFIGEDVISQSRNLVAICTASTGTVHIDMEFALSKGIEVISLKNELETLKKLSSTAELALGLTISLLRSITSASDSAKHGEWDYRPFTGKQIRSIVVGVVGFGRLGSMYARYIQAMGGRVIVFDPYVSDHSLRDFTRVPSLTELFSQCDVISLHAHLTHETGGFVDASVLDCAKKSLILINTARGELVNEHDLLGFMNLNPSARYGADVLSDEIHGTNDNPIMIAARGNFQFLITPHIGGMTEDGKEIAYERAVELLEAFASRVA